MTTMLTAPTSSKIVEASAKPSAPPQEQLASKEAFLQLLVSQIKNQNPLNPTDGVEFLTQLAQFSELEQMMGMRSDLSQIREALKPVSTGLETE